MSIQAVPRETTSGGWSSRLTAAIGRQRELSLTFVMLVLGVFVTLQAPRFLDAANLKPVAVLAAIIAIASVGEALTIITRNVDLSVESIIGLVAFVVADMLSLHVLDPSLAIFAGMGLGLVLGMVNGIIVTVLGVPAIVATLGTLSVYRGIDFMLAGGHQISLGDLPPGYTDAATETIVGIPLFVWIALIVVVISGLILRQTRFGRDIYAVGSNPEAAATAGVRSGLITFTVFSVCGLLSGLAGVLWGIEFGSINATAASGVSLQVIAACVVGGVAIFGGSGSVVGAALGALFLGFISNALILLRLSQFWLEAIYGAVILIAVSADEVIISRLRAAAQERRAQ